MPGVRALRRIQLGSENTPGEVVAAQEIWRGTGVLEDLRETRAVAEDVGLLSGGDRQMTSKLLAGLTLESTPATFDQFIHILNGSMQYTNGYSNTPGTGYVYEYALLTTSQNTVMTYTVEGGDNQAVERMEYAFVESFKLSGKGGEPVMMQAVLRGRQISDASFSEGILIDVEAILFNKGTIYIDSVNGRTNPEENTLLGFELSVKTGLVPVFSADGQLYFSFVKGTMPDVLLNVTFEHNGTAVDEKSNWRNGTARAIRLVFAGSSLATPGPYTTKMLTIDVAGKWEKFEKLGEQNGNDIVTGAFRARYNSTADEFASFTVVLEDLGGIS